MNRRTLIASSIAALVMGKSHRADQVAAMDTTSPPARLDGDDTAYLQWHIDTGTEIPADWYRATDTLIVDDHSKGIRMSGSRVVFAADVPVFIDFVRTPRVRCDSIEYCTMIWEPQP